MNKPAQRTPMALINAPPIPVKNHTTFNFCFTSTTNQSSSLNTDVTYGKSHEYMT